MEAGSSERALKVESVIPKKKRNSTQRIHVGFQVEAALLSAWGASCRTVIINIEAQPLSEALVPAARPMSAHYWLSIKATSLYNLSTYLGELKEFRPRNL